MGNSKPGPRVGNPYKFKCPFCRHRGSWLWRIKHNDAACADHRELVRDLVRALNGR